MIRGIAEGVAPELLIWFGGICEAGAAIASLLPKSRPWFGGLTAAGSGITAFEGWNYKPK